MKQSNYLKKVKNLKKKSKIGLFSIMFAAILFTCGCDKESEARHEQSTVSQEQPKSLISGEDYIVATSDKSFFQNGDELSLTFSQSEFLIGYQQTLTDSISTLMEAENVRAVMYLLDSALVPMLAVSAYDVDDEHSVNIYLPLKTIIDGNTHYFAASRNTVSIKCIGTGACAIAEVCYPYQNSNGLWVCYPCLTSTGTCTREVTLTVEQNSIFKTLDDLLI